MSSQNSYAEPQTLPPQNATLFGDRSFTEEIELKWGHWSGSWCNMTGIFTKRGEFGQRHACYETQGEDSHLQAKRRGREETLPSHIQKEPTLLTPWFQTSSFQNCEKINFCLFQTLSLWYFIMSALANEEHFCIQNGTQKLCKEESKGRKEGRNYN